MRAKLETLPMTELRELAKVNGIKGITTMRKAALIDKILEVADSGKNAGESSAKGNEKSSENSIEIKEIKNESSHSNRTKAVSEENKQESNSLVTTEMSKRPAKSTANSSYRNENHQRTEYTSRNINQQKSEGYQRNDSVQRTDSIAKLDNAQKAENVQRTENSRNNKFATAAEASKHIGITPEQSVQPYISVQQKQEMLRKQALEEQIDLSLDSGVVANGILEIMPDGFGFIRCENYLPGDNDVYVSPVQIKKFGLKTGDIILGKVRIKTQNEKFGALLFINTLNGVPLAEAMKRKNFEDLTPIFPNERLVLETDRHNMAMRIVDIMSPIGKGQRGMIVSPPKAGKTTLLKEIAKSIIRNNPEMHLIVLLIDERPEEVTDIKEAIEGSNVEVIYSTFDELPEHHKRVSEMVVERAKRLVEHGKDVTILLDSITRLARAYNIVIPASGRTLSGGLDPAALHMPKRFFGAARNMREGGSLTILATALVETGSRMDDVIFEEFKGTGNMELVLDRKLSERRVFPAIDILKSGTRRDDLLLNGDEKEAVDIIRRATNNQRPEETVEKIIDLFSKTKNNAEFCQMIKKIKL
ncbi:MAG: transcription termination factor Rho [Lachnospiraceae bacterium]|nr:transcription termination factor Rho [Lachnospiraceae bacterium]